MNALPFLTATCPCTASSMVAKDSVELEALKLNGYMCQRKRWQMTRSKCDRILGHTPATQVPRKMELPAVESCSVPWRAWADRQAKLSEQDVRKIHADISDKDI